MNRHAVQFHPRETAEKRLRVSSRAEWRRWLAANHAKQKDGVWLVYRRKATGHLSLGYEESLREALCFGWIDSVIRKIDDATYCRKFTPRKDTSKWSVSNKKRVTDLIKEGIMAQPGLAKVQAAKRSGCWDVDPRPVIRFEMPPELSESLSRNKAAQAFFKKLAPTYRKQFIAWIVTAKRPETKAKRIEESLALLAKGEKLGLK